MDVKFKARSLWNTGKEVAIRCTKSMTDGIRFSEMYTVIVSGLNPLIPTSLEYSVHCTLAFLLFHAYLLYVLIFCVSLEILRKFKTKGSGISPIGGCVKEKASVFLAYFFVFQSISKITFGATMWNRFVGWACQVKPQFNFKPQIKIGKSKSSDSVVSVKSKMGTSLNVGLESDDEGTRKSMKNLGTIKKSMDFATDMVDSLLCDRQPGKEERRKDFKSSDFLAPESSESRDSEASACLVQKWLEDSESMDSEDVRLHVKKLVAENEQMKRQSSMFKPAEDPQTEA